MQSLFGSTLSVPWVKQSSCSTCPLICTLSMGQFEEVHVKNFNVSMCHKYVQTRLTQSDTIYLIWYQAASRSSLVLCFCVPSPPIPRGTVYNRIKTHLSVASNLTSPATGAGNTRRGQTLMLDIEEPPLGSAKKVQRGQNLLRSMFHLAHLGCTVFSVVLAFNVFSCCIYIYDWLWLYRRYLALA